MSDDNWAWDDHIPSGVHGMDGYDSVSCSCGWDSETGKLGWVEHIRAMGADSLDAAWAEAEAALPEGMVLRAIERTRELDDHRRWTAEAESRGGQFADDYRRIRQTGSTPAAALRALTAKLRERAG